MDYFDDIHASEFVTESDDQDSLDDQIESEQRRSNTHLWASFQNAACCITKLYKDKTQSNVLPWIPFQSAASNLTTLYKDCIESQKKFARIGYQVGRRRKAREFAKWLKKHKIASKHQPAVADLNGLFEGNNDASSRQHNNVSAILNVNQLNLGRDSPPHPIQQEHHQQVSQQQQLNQHQNQSQNVQFLLGNGDDDLSTFQEALVAQTKSQKSHTQSSNHKRPSSNITFSPRALEERGDMSEEDRLHELNQFLSEEYHRHVGSTKRACANTGGNSIKRIRE